MNIPGLLGAVLLFWGWRSGYLGLAVPMALLLEANRWIEWRWALSPREFDRLADATSLAVIGFAFYAISQPAAKGIFLILVWLPLAFYPLVLAQVYSLNGQLTYANLFWSLRRGRKAELPQSAVGRLRVRPVDLRPIYFGLCVLAATAVPQPDRWLGVWLTVLVLWPLLFNRRGRWVTWLLAITLAVSLAYGIQDGLRRMQDQVKSAFISWMVHDWGDEDLQSSATAIGQLGELKTSSGILFRLLPEADADARQPPLLRQASYQTYRKEVWYALDESAWTALPAGAKLGNWVLAAESGGDTRRLRLRGGTQGGKSMLPLPAQTVQVDGLLARLYTSPLGVVKAEDVPGFLDIGIVHGASASQRDAPPDEHDLSLPKEQQGLLQTLAATLGLEPSLTQQNLTRIAGYFTRVFRYSLIQTAAQENSPPLSYFLTESKQGHCEHYASATVLLLRAAGIPARYATGYAPVEYSRWENAWRIRARHAHAWAIAWVDGRWIDIDNTPSIWAESEAEATPWWRTPADVVSWLWDSFQAWYWGTQGEVSTNRLWLGLLLAPLTFYVGWRLIYGERKRLNRRGKTAPARPAVASSTAFNQVILRIEAHAGPKPPGETLESWINRLTPETWPALSPLLQLHYRQRFGKNPLTQTEQGLLEDGVQDWLGQCNNGVRHDY